MKTGLVVDKSINGEVILKSQQYCCIRASANDKQIDDNPLISVHPFTMISLLFLALVIKNDMIEGIDNDNYNIDRCTLMTIRRVIYSSICKNVHSMEFVYTANSI